MMCSIRSSRVLSELYVRSSSSSTARSKLEEEEEVQVRWIEGDNRKGELLMPDGQMNNRTPGNKTRRFDSRSTQGDRARMSYIIVTINAAINDLGSNLARPSRAPTIVS